MGGLGEIRGKELHFPKDLKGNDTFYTEFAGFSNDASDYNIRVENRQSGGAVLITGDQPLANIGVWAVRTVVAPEPFVNINVPAGSEFRWGYKYTFYTVATPTGTPR